MTSKIVLPNDMAKALGKRVKDLRLARKWRQETLAAKSGVSIATLRRFENTGRATIVTLLRLAFTLGRLADFEDVLTLAPVRSLSELAERETHAPKRGRR